MTLTITGTDQHRAWQQRVLPPVEQVRPGVFSIPVPIPDNPLRYTLSYAFLDDSGVLLVDPGWDAPECRAALTDGLHAAGASIGAVTGVVVTHIHPDHHWLSRWVREQSGAWIGMHPREADGLPNRIWRGRTRDDDHRWLLRHGVPEDEAAVLSPDPDRVNALMNMADPDRAIEDGDLLPLARHTVRAIWTPGHTPGHLCLHDADAGILLTGDHLLPRISPNIGITPGSDADPLSAYLASLEGITKFGADEALPAHEYRFRGIDTRAAELVAHHEDRGREILALIDALGTPTAWTIAAGLTWSRGWDALRGLMRRMALAETLAHLNHLTTRAQARGTDTTPVRWTR